MGIGGLGFGEMVLVFAVLLLLFGAKRLPELASGMGKGIRDFKRAVNGMEEPTLPSAPTPPAVEAPPAPATQLAATPEAEKAEKTDAA